MFKLPPAIGVACIIPGDAQIRRKNDIVCLVGRHQDMIAIGL